MKGIPESHVRKEEDDHDEKSLKIWDCGSPLYDSYELVAVSHIVERHFMILPHHTGSRNLPTGSPSLTSSAEKPGRDDAASKNAGKSSVISFLSEFMERNVWKRKMDGERKQKDKKRKSGISRIFQWKK